MKSKGLQILQTIGNKFLIFLLPSKNKLDKSVIFNDKL